MVWKVMAAIFVAFVLASAAQAASQPNAQLDAAGTAIATKSVSVYCETDTWEWTAWEQRFNLRMLGFTYPDSIPNTAPFAPRTLYIGPRECLTLIGLTQHEDMGTYESSIAILVLTHEAIHQRLNSLDEALVECNALKEVRDVAVKQFLVPETVAERYIANVTKIVRRGKKRVRVTTPVVKERQVPNPYLDALVRDAKRWDQILPESYHGAVC